ncbi:MAG: prephenate dehydrogenase [Anaerolineae bacterium]|nr:prephenate dehydrogenase [Anaerolineae bacterium]
MEGCIAIIGLGCTGTSIGLALRHRWPQLEVRGHDGDSEFANQALQMGAVSKTYGNLRAACKDASMVILDLPLPSLRRTLEILGPSLSEGCIVTETGPLKVPVIQWARDYLPEHARFIAGTPIPGPVANVEMPLQRPDAAKVDMFKDGLYCITHAVDTAPGAVAALENLARDLEARPLFLDPVEHDGLHAGVAGLPTLLAMALLHATVGSPGWEDMRKVAGYDFATLTSLLADDPIARQEGALLNKENLLLRLDLFMKELYTIRQWLQESDTQTFAETFQKASRGRARWLSDRTRGWQEERDISEIPTFKDQVSEMFVGRLFRRRPPREND